MRGSEETQHRSPFNCSPSRDWEKQTYYSRFVLDVFVNSHNHLIFEILLLSSSLLFILLLWLLLLSVCLFVKSLRLLKLVSSSQSDFWKFFWWKGCLWRNWRISQNCLLSKRRRKLSNDFVPRTPTLLNSTYMVCFTFFLELFVSFLTFLLCRLWFWTWGSESSCSLPSDSLSTDKD